MRTTSRAAGAAAAGGLLVAGLAAGVALGLSGSATADQSSAPSYGAPGGASGGGPGGAPGGSFDPSKSVRPDEHLLTGTTADKVRAAALAKYPGATVQRVETDSEGVYEAHLLTKAGAWVTVQVGKDFTVTGTQTGGPGGPGGPGGHGPGDHDGDGPDGDGPGTAAPQQS